MNVWKTQDGRLIPFNKMASTHLFYAVRLIWNHTAPPYLQLPGGRYSGPEDWSPKRKIQLLHALLTELSKRNDLPVSLDIQLGIMRDRAKQFGGKGLLN